FLLQHPRPPPISALLPYTTLFRSMLHKNFGVTRHGRVIFYDYDEICYMTERHFRYLPKSDDPYALDSLSVAPDDVFPEQFEENIDRKSTRLNSSHVKISYAVFCLK